MLLRTLLGPALGEAGPLHVVGQHPDGRGWGFIVLAALFLLEAGRPARPASSGRPAPGPVKPPEGRTGDLHPSGGVRPLPPVLRFVPIPAGGEASSILQRLPAAAQAPVIGEAAGPHVRDQDDALLDAGIQLKVGSLVHPHRKTSRTLDGEPTGDRKAFRTPR